MILAVWHRHAPRAPPSQNHLQLALEAMLASDFACGILSTAAIAYAKMVVDRREAGRPIAQLDAQIAASTQSRGAALATQWRPAQ